MDETLGDLQTVREEKDAAAKQLLRKVETSYEMGHDDAVKRGERRAQQLQLQLDAAQRMQIWRSISKE